MRVFILLPVDLEVNQVKKHQLVMINLKRVYFPDLANMSDIDTPEPKNETKASFYYLKDEINKLFKDHQNIFDLDLKKFFKDIASEEEKNINYNLLLKEISLLSRNTFSFFLIGMVIFVNFALLCLKKNKYTQTASN